jgi:1-acyl-sn-glycerol-3-phosphate acyltransferase
VRFLWPFLNALQLAFTAVWTAGCISFAGVVYLLSRSRRIALELARHLWAPGLLLFAGARLRVRGRDGAIPELPAGPCLFVANHQSVIDICVLFRGLPRPVRFVAKQELRRLPFVGWYIGVMGMAFVDRRARGGLGMVEAMGRLLESGSDVILFPEGTRSRDGSIGAFKPGGFQAAVERQAPVVPIAIRGAGAVLPPGGFRVRPGPIEVVVGEPIVTAPGIDRQQLAREAEAAVRGLFGEPPAPAAR